MKAFKTQEGKQAVFDYYNFLLERLTVPYEELNIDTRHGDTHIIAVGDRANKPLVLLHGSSSTSSMWFGDMARLSQEFRVYAPDIPGEPGKSDETQLHLNTSDYVDWLLDVMNGLSIETVLLGGTSLGAWLAAKFAINYPQKVSRIVLLCPAGIGSQNHAFKDIAMPLIAKGDAGVNELFTQMNGGASMPEIVINYSKLIAWAFNARQEAIPLFKDDELKKLTMPCRVFLGAKDIVLCSDETASRLANIAPSVEVIMLPEKGHVLVELTDQYIGFLK